MSSNGEQMRQRASLFQDATSDEDVLGAFTNPEEWLSRAQIAGRCFRRPTPSFVVRLEELVKRGLIVRSSEPLANGYKKFWYRLARA